MGGVQAANHPPTPATDDSDRIQGVEFLNPFGWLENLDTPEVAAWVAAQDAFTQDQLAPSMTDTAALRARMHGYDASFRINTPSRRGNRFFYLAEGPDRPGRALYLHSEGADRVIAEQGDFGAIGFGPAQIDDFRVAPSARLVAISGTEDATARRVVRILDVETGAYLTDIIEGARLGEEPWSADERSIYFARWHGDTGGSAWRRHLVSGEEHRLAGGQGRRYRLAYAQSLGGAVIVERSVSGAHRAWFAVADGAAAAPALMLEADGVLRFIGAVEDRAFFYETGRDRIVAVRGAPGGYVTRQVMDIAALSATSAHIYAGRIVINGLDAGAPAIFVHRPDGTHLRTFHPPFGLVWTNFPAGRPAIFGDPHSSFAYLNSIALESPGVYEINLASLEMRPWRLREGVAPGAVSIVRRRYRSADGQDVPIVLAHRRDVVLAAADGPSDASPPPVLMWVYGAHRYTAIPFFNGFFRTFIDAGGVLVMPQVRGGGAFGAAWHDAGSGANKVNTVADTIAALAWLREEGIGAPGRVAVIGNSAGSVPAAIAAIRRPDLVDALILEIPLSDLVRHARWSSGWATEFGVPDVPEQFETLRAVSPYEALQEPRRLPPTLIFAGENDTVSPPHHAYKLAAAMQRAQTGDAPILLRLVRGAGHQIGVDAAQRFESQSYQLAFLHEVLGVGIDRTPPVEEEGDGL